MHAIEDEDAPEGVWETFQSELECGCASTQPLATYVLQVVKHLEVWEPEADWQSRWFYAVRILKRHPDLAGLTGPEVVEKLWALGQRWALRVPKRQREDAMGWLLGQEDHDEARTELQVRWGRVRFPEGMTPLEAALHEADAHPLVLKTFYYTPTYHRFLSAAGWLQAMVGDAPIILACRSVSALFDVGLTTASRYMNCGIEDKYLTRLKKGRLLGKGAREASEFRFAVDRCPVLLERYPIERPT